MVNEDEQSEVEMRCRIQQGANAREKVEGVMLDRNILKKLKRKVLRACVTQACLNLYLVTVALTEQQQLKLVLVLSNNTKQRGLTKEG